MVTNLRQCGRCSLELTDWREFVPSVDVVVELNTTAVVVLQSYNG